MSIGKSKAANRSTVAAWQHQGVPRPTFIENLMAELKKHGLPQSELSRRCGIDAGTISKWKKGRLPNGPDLVVVAKFLSIDPELLLGRDARELLPSQGVPRRGRPPKADVQAERLLDGGPVVGAADGVATSPVSSERRPSPPKPPKTKL